VTESLFPEIIRISSPRSARKQAWNSAINLCRRVVRAAHNYFLKSGHGQVDNPREEIEYRKLMAKLSACGNCLDILLLP